MPFNRPTPQDLLQRIQAVIDIELPGADARLRGSVENVIARVLAMASHGMHGHIDYVAKQLFITTAEAENLDREAEEYGMSRKAATAATGNVTFTGTNGSIIPAGTALRRADSVEFTTAAEVSIAAGSATVSVTAAVAGAAGNTADGVKLNLSSPLAGVQLASTVAAPGLSGGADIEGDEALRQRVLARKRQPPHGGADFDYIEWAKEVAGVTRAWVYRHELGVGTVMVFFVMDDKVDTLVPDENEVLIVQNYLDAQRPVTADVYAAAPTPLPVNFEIHIRPNTSLVRAAIEAELKDFFKREAVPGGVLYRSRLIEAISAAAGEFAHVLIAPAGNVEASFGEIAVLGDLTFEEML